MALAKLTLIGMYNTMPDDDPLFKKMILPEGIDREVFINSLLMECGEMETLFADPIFYQSMIGVWSQKWERTFSKWFEALQLEYDPIDNYNRFEEITEQRKIEHSGTDKRTGKTTSSGSDNVTSVSEKSAYDRNGYSPYERDTNNGSSSGTVNSDDSGENSYKDQDDFTRKARLHGNIGVTTSQQMLESELDIDRWNLYSHMIDIFEEELLIAVY